MKGTIEFDLERYEDRARFNDALNASELREKLDSIYEVVLRPYFKHGYSSKIMQSKIDAIEAKEAGEELQELMEFLRTLMMDHVNGE